MRDTLVPHPPLWLRIFTNVQLLNAFYGVISDLYSLALAFLDRFPMTYFITEISFVSVNGLLKMIRTCSTGHTGSIPMKAFRAGTHTHTHITDKCNFKKPGMA